MLNTHGIYCLYFENDNAKYYIGKSLNIVSRFEIHCRDLRNNVHHNIHLQKAFAKYKCFPSIYILEIPNIASLAEREIFWIKQFDSYHTGYNRTGGGEGAGYGHTASSSIYDEETYALVLHMLALSNATIISVSKELGISSNVVTSIALGTSHQHLSIEYPEIYSAVRKKHGNYSTLRKFDDVVYANILKDLAFTSDRYNTIASRYNVSESIVEDIGRGSTHKYLEKEYPEIYKTVQAKKGYRHTGHHSGKAYPPVLSPSGVVYTVTNAKAFVKEHGLHQGHFAELLNGKVKSHKKWVLAQ